MAMLVYRRVVYHIFSVFLWDDFWDASFQISKDYLERDKEGGGTVKTLRFSQRFCPQIFGAKAKGAGLVHGENWAAKCEPVEISVARITLPKSNGWIPKIAIIKGSYLFQTIHVSFRECKLFHSKRFYFVVFVTSSQRHLLSKK